MSYQSIYDHDAIQEANASMYGQTWDTTYASPESAEMIHLPTGRCFVIHWTIETDSWTGRIVYRMTGLTEYSDGQHVTSHDLTVPKLDDWFDPHYPHYEPLIDAAEQMTEYIISNT